MRALVLLPTDDTVSLRDYDGASPTTLQTLQDEVGGFIEVVPVCPTAALVVAEDRTALAYNERASLLYGKPIRGTAVLLGMDGGPEFVDVPTDIWFAAHAVIETKGAVEG